jgi:hypothetical protein
MSIESIYTRIAQTCWHSGGHPLEVIADVLKHALGRDEGGEGSAAGRARLAALASGFSPAEPGHQPGAAAVLSRAPAAGPVPAF